MRMDGVRAFAWTTSRAKDVRLFWQERVCTRLVSNYRQSEGKDRGGTR
jgi:hypothetical protein